MEIREFRDTDQEQAVGLIIELQDHEHQVDPYRLPGAKVAKPYLARLVKDAQEKQGKIYVAEIDNQIVGLIALIIEHFQVPLLTKINHFGTISDLVVSGKFRSQGIGQDLMNQAEAYFKSHQLKFVRIAVVANNTRAWDFYHKVGFQDFEIELVKELK